MRPTLAIVPLALLLSWFGPSPSGEPDRAVSFGLSAAPPPDTPAEPSAARQVAMAWESFQWSGLLQTTAEQPNRR